MARQIPLHVEVEGHVFSRRTTPYGGYEYLAQGIPSCELVVAEEAAVGGVEQFVLYWGNPILENRKKFRGRAALTNACKFAVKKVLKREQKDVV